MKNTGFISRPVGSRLFRIAVILTFLLLGRSTFSQTISSVRDGNWNDPAVWSPGIVPEANNSSSVAINHHIVVPDGTSVSVDDLQVNHILEVHTSAELRLENGAAMEDMALDAGGTLHIYGTWTTRNGAMFTGTSEGTTKFHAGSIYRHDGPAEGVIPEAEWDLTSTFELKGLQGNITLQSPLWGQSFGNFIYDCPGQGQFVEFKGLLRDIRGDFRVVNTNRSVLRLAQSQDLILTVGGDMTIEGPSEVWFGMTGTSTIDIGGNLNFSSTSTASSYFTTTGTTNCLIRGTFNIDAVHRLKMASSTAQGITRIDLEGDLMMVDGILDALGTGRGTLRFMGSMPQQLYIDNATAALDGDVSIEVAPGAEVQMGNSRIDGTGSMSVSGILGLGSPDAGGVIQQGGGGNINLTGGVQFHQGAEIRLVGSQQQIISNPDFGNALVKIANTAGVSLSNPVQFHDLNILQGELHTQGFTCNLSGDLSCSAGASMFASAPVKMNGNGAQTVDVNGAIFPVLEIEETATSVSLSSALLISGGVRIISPGATLHTMGHLTLLSSDNAPAGTACIEALPPGSAVTGSVEVQRFIHSIQGGYRYISAPVKGATVASLKDDVNVTGTFEDPSVGDGIPSNEPSLFFFDEPTGMWMPYPVSGTATENPLTEGRGFCFYDYNGDENTLWDVSGEIVQGPYAYQLTFTPTGDPETEGWNLVGNPYPSAIRWGGSGWTLNEAVSAGIAVRDNEIGGFRYWDGAAGNLPDGRIALGQSFWVHTNSADPELSIDEPAKANGGAFFYRNRTADVLELRVSAGRFADETYFRLRPKASTGVDPFDVPKFLNDSLSVWLLTDDGKRVAISAVGKLKCSDEVPVQVRLENNRDEEVTFQLRTSGAFSTSSVTLYDPLTGKSYPFAGDTGITLPTGPLTTRQFTLRIESGEFVPVNFSAPKELCPGDSLEVVLDDELFRGRLYLENNAGEWDPVRIMGTRLIFPPELLSPGNNALAVWTYSPCGDKLLLDSLRVYQRNISSPDVKSGYTCGAGEVVLRAKKSTGEGELWWYESAAGDGRIGRGEEFFTPRLEHSREYYVLHRDRSCESDRVAVSAEVYPALVAELRLHDQQLTTSAEGMYTWLFNDLIVHSEENSIELTSPGHYTVIVRNGLCTATSSFDYLITGEAEQIVPGVAVFPNPCDETLGFSFRENDAVREIFIRSSGGSLVWSQRVDCLANTCSIDVSALEPGFYILEIRDDRHSRFVRFIKR